MFEHIATLASDLVSSHISTCRPTCTHAAPPYLRSCQLLRCSLPHPSSMELERLVALAAGPAHGGDGAAAFAPAAGLPAAVVEFHGGIIDLEAQEVELEQMVALAAAPAKRHKQRS